MRKRCQLVSRDAFIFIALVVSGVSFRFGKLKLATQLSTGLFTVPAVLIGCANASAVKTSNPIMLRFPKVSKQNENN